MTLLTWRAGARARGSIELFLLGDGVLRSGRGGRRGEEGEKTEQENRKPNSERQAGESGHWTQRQLKSCCCLRKLLLEKNINASFPWLGCIQHYQQFMSIIT